MAHKIISMFTGAGGMDLGFEAAGFDVSIAVESDLDCIDTLKANRPHWKVANPASIEEISPKLLLKQAKLKRREASMIIGGPPCQPFSKSRLWVNGDTPGLLDHRADTLQHFFRHVDVALPKAVLIENVIGISQSDSNGGIELIEAKFKSINSRNRTNYKPVYFRVNAADYGVPQRRHRLFTVVHRDGMQFRMPEPTHFDRSKKEEDDGSKPRYLTAWDAIGHIDTPKCDPDLVLSGKWASLIPSIPEGQNYLWHTNRGGGLPLFGWRTRYWSFLLKLSKREPSWTLQASPGPATGPFHWRNRRLSVNEMCRIQTFPDEYIVAGNYRSATRQIGNAVPPLLAEVIAKEVMAQFFGKKNGAEPNFKLNENSARTRRHPVQKVPDIYLADLASHDDHPGTGKGPRALMRQQEREVQEE